VFAPKRKGIKNGARCAATVKVTVVARRPLTLRSNENSQQATTITFADIMKSVNYQKLGGANA